ncbi:MAG: diaminopimelate epimerase [bacterium]|nr:MAG: diaminopimelate epimerase [bacterium]
MPKTRLIKFAKYQGLGNDFIVIDDRSGSLKLSKKNIIRLCDRRLGIGCDQLLIVRASDTADFKMALYNRDGSSAEMCGNGIRCLARFLYSAKVTRKKNLTFETAAGLITTKMQNGSVEVDMGEPILDGERVPINHKGMMINSPLKTSAGSFNITAVSMGNPHAVIFVNSVDDLPLDKYGPAVENHPLFPKKTNVEFAQVKTSNKIVLRVWERGVGATPACGTGACATLVAAVMNKLTGRSVTVSLPGGSLKIRWDRKTNHVFMTGPAQESFTGSVKF